ncbi:protein CYCLOPS-like [Zingiber officinale]|uniref:protein CYCLOPS-like n=1 Tax=Zingiber officinale TaxID=94328 RepID=UPI001C4B983C|nr:protein CYCLOPS-like [Zingiber officinale]
MEKIRHEFRGDTEGVSMIAPNGHEEEDSDSITRVFQNKSGVQQSKEKKTSSAHSMTIPGFSSANDTNHTCQMSRKISSEIIAFGNQQTGTAQKTNTEDNSLSLLNDHSYDIWGTIRNAAEKSIQAINLLLAQLEMELYGLVQVWHINSCFMEVRMMGVLRGPRDHMLLCKSVFLLSVIAWRRYVAMQNQIQAIIESQNNSTILGVAKGPTMLRNEFCNASMVETGTQVQTFMSLSNSATSPFDTLSVAAVDPNSSAVSILKGSLKNKRLAREVTSNVVSNIQTENSMTKVEISLESNTEAFLSPVNQFRTGTVSQEPSQIGSSTAVLAFSTGFDACDDLVNSAQTNSICESTKRPIGSQNWNHKSVDYGENTLQNNVKDDRKLSAIHSPPSKRSYAEDKGDPTKKRLVELSRKMADAKERSLAPALPPDMQAVLKRCETLEKEVRSLKLNLSFMNSTLSINNFGIFFLSYMATTAFVGAYLKVMKPLHENYTAGVFH